MIMHDSDWLTESLNLFYSYDTHTQNNESMVSDGQNNCPLLSNVKNFEFQSSMLQCECLVACPILAKLYVQLGDKIVTSL